MNRAGSVVSKTEEEICGESTPLIQKTMSVVKIWIEVRQPSSFNWDVSYMDTGLDAALRDSLDGMEYLFTWLWSFSLYVNNSFKITPSRDGVLKAPRVLPFKFRPNWE